MDFSFLELLSDDVLDSKPEFGVVFVLVAFVSFVAFAAIKTIVTVDAATFRFGRLALSIRRVAILRLRGRSRS